MTQQQILRSVRREINSVESSRDLIHRVFSMETRRRSTRVKKLEEQKRQKQIEVNINFDFSNFGFFRQKIN